MRTMLFSAFFLAALLCINQTSHASLIWNESSDGDLSTSPSTPTALNFTTGPNSVVGTLSQPTGDIRDYLTFTIGPGQSLTALTLDAYVADGVGFQGLNAGSTSFIPGVDPGSNFLGLEFVIVDF